MALENKTYPEELKEEISKALSHYPELKNVTIHFRYNDFSAKSYMLAQPVVKTLLRSKEKREYQILMRKDFWVENEQFENGRIPSVVMVGWLGHELGHIMDYKDRSSLNLAFFGFKYQFFNSFLKKAEITADYNAVKAGLAQELVISKEFGRNPKYFPADYIAKLQDLYPTVNLVKQWANELGHSFA